MDAVRDRLTFDFETAAIGPRPAQYPPNPVGLAYKLNDGPTEYLSWGHHDSGTKQERAAAYAAARMLLDYHFRKGSILICHNARFDIEVATAALGIAPPAPDCVQDTLVLGSLVHPLAKSLSLKPLSEQVLGLPPTEQSAVRDWLVQHGHCHPKDKGWGAHISLAPTVVVGPYAIGDVDRTERLFKVLAPKVLAAGMTSANQVEQQLSPILTENERVGIRVDRNRLKVMRTNLSKGLAEADAAIRKALKAPDLNIDSGEQLADALEKAGKAPGGFPKTATGRRSTAKEALLLAVVDEALRGLLRYRGVTATLLTTFVEPWLAMSAGDGRLHPSWNSVRGEAGGTRTGRLSCSHPNLQNVPKKFDVPVPAGYPALPNLRTALLPEEGHVWVSADFNSQELRVLAHFAEGELERLFKDNPELDLHAKAASLITERTGRHTDRKATKIIAFSLIYGAGNATMAARLGTSIDEAAALREAYYDALPGVRELIQDVKAVAAKGEAVRTVGGRLLHAPRGDDGRSKDYAMVNYLIQGSSADQTKQSIVTWNPRRGASVFICSVHDEVNISVPDTPEGKIKAKRWLRLCMEKPILSVPSRVTITTGPSWGEQS